MLDRDLREAVTIALEAGRILMELYRTDLKVAYKTRSDPVTEADTRANAYIVDALRRAFPADGVVSEENDDISDALRQGRCWYVDPIDGTKEFIAQNGEFAVMLGLAIDGEATLGVVFQPAHERLYTGIVGVGAHLEQGGQRRPLVVSDIADPRELALVVSRSQRGRRIDAIKARLGVTRESRSGSVGLKVGLIAEQRADLYVHLSSRSSAWDACGPEAVLRAAGGRFTDLGGAPYRYGGTDMKNSHGILACNAAAYDTVLPVVSEVAGDLGLVG